MPKLFTMFAQDPMATTRSEGGLGIGLALAHGIVALHGGHMRYAARDRAWGASSSSGCLVGYRLKTGLKPERDVNAPPNRTALRVLIVDDNRDAADSCATLVRLSGHHVQTAYTGQQAFEFAVSAPPQVILADIGLPDIDGYALAQRIRAAPWGQSVTLIAISGWGQDEDRRRAMEAGFDSHLTKPIEPQTVEALLQSLEAKLNSLPLVNSWGSHGSLQPALGVGRAARATNERMELQDRDKFARDNSDKSGAKKGQDQNVNKDEQSDDGASHGSLGKR